MSIEKKRTTIAIDKDIFIKIKLLAVKKSITIGELANEAFKMLLESEKYKEGDNKNE